MLDRFSIILLAYESVRAAGTSGSFQDRFFRVFQTAMFIAFARCLLIWYDAPIPGVGISFSNLVTDESAFLVNTLDTSSLERLHGHLSQIWASVSPPSLLSGFALIVYGLLFVLVFLAKAISLFVIAYGFIASAVCGLLGPVFVVFLVWKPMSWLFWGWLRAFIQYSMLPVVAMALVMIFEQFMARVLTTLPPEGFVGVGDYAVYVYSMIVMIATLILSLAFTPSLTASLFSGHVSQGPSAGGGVLYMLTRR
jgi:type IV secretory pathway VirB6-like protein